MKKLYILGLLGLGIAANAQQASKTPSTKVNVASPAVNTKNIDYTPASPVRVSNGNGSTQSRNVLSKTGGNAVKVGSTQFDRQTNSSIYRRILVYGDGKVSVNWLTSSDGSANNYLGRGSGYNHFNGTAWGTISANRIEAFRAGYPSFDYDGTSEVIVSHKIDTAGKSGGLGYSTNGAIGSTNWTSKVVLAPAANQPSVLWPRTVVSGNYMHVIANYTTPSKGQPGDTVYVAGVKSPTVYSRYRISDSTWEVTNIALPGYDSTRWYDGGADGYAIDAKGANVAILMGGTTNDITLWKSADNGITWTNTIIDSFPVPAFNDQVTIEDTPNVCDGSLNVRLDASGKAHCFWGRLRINNTTTGDNSFSVFLGTNSIDYWYEGRPTAAVMSVGGAPDANGNGSLDAGTIDSRTRYGNAGVATMPCSVIGPDGTVYVIYSALTEDDLDGQGAAYRDVYIVSSKDNGVTWSKVRNLTGDLGFNREQMFGSAAIANNTLHVTYMESAAVGFYDATNNANKTGPFDIMYYNISLSAIDSIIPSGLAEQKNNLFTVGSNYPNPFRNSTIIPIKLTEKADVKVSVMNILGETVYTHTYNNTTVGANELEITSDFKSGFYFYNVEAGGFKTSGKMIAE